jgi:hypothetical protein
VENADLNLDKLATLTEKTLNAPPDTVLRRGMEEFAVTVFATAHV